MIKGEIIADSINPYNNRLTTFVLEFPRFVLPELATHRVFSKNSASSRAIPFEKFVEQVQNNPAMHVWWGKNQSGMQANEEIGNIDLAKEYWLTGREKAIENARLLNSIGLHKQIVNRVLEAWFNIRIILSGTEFENFFALRAHKDAQPEIRVLAELMLEKYNKSDPKSLKPGDWHIPFGDKFDDKRIMDIVSDMAEYMGDADILEDGTNLEIRKKIAIARCARVSYINYEGKDDYQADLNLFERLVGSVPRHFSPLEHVAESQANNQFIGNFRGWKQYRYFYPDQNLSDSRVIKKFYQQ